MSTQSSRKQQAILDYSVVSLGLALCRSWIIIIVATPLAEDVIAYSDSLFLLPGAIAAFLVAGVAFGWRKSRPDSTLLRWFTGIGILAFLALTLVVFALPSTIVVAIQIVVGGVTSSCLQILWGVAFAQRGLQYSLRSYPASAIATALFAILALGGSLLVPLVLFPLLSWTLYLVSQALPSRKMFTLIPDDPDARHDTNGKKHESFVLTLTTITRPAFEKPPLKGELVIRLIISIAIFSFLCRLYDALPGSGQNDPLDAFGGSSLVALMVVGAGFLLCMVFLGKRFNSLVAYRMAIPLMAFGMAVYSLFFTSHWFVSILLIGIGYELFDTLTWMLLVELARSQRKRYPYQVIFGLGTGATLIGMCFGYMAGSGMHYSVLVGEVQVASVAIISVVLLIATAFMLIPEGTITSIFTRKEDSTKHPPEAEVNPSDGTPLSPLEANCDKVSERYHLTPREAEVLVLLARGRTLAIIVRDLQIAKGTARTHIENIYQKLGVHKQQELIDLVESFESDR